MQTRNRIMGAPLVVGLLVAALGLCAPPALGLRPQGTSVQDSTGSTSITASLIRLRANRLRRPEFCRENLPRKAEDLPALVITGRVKEVYLANEANNSSGGQESNRQQAALNRALVNVGRVLRGNQQLVGGDILVSGFNSSNATPCPNYIKPNDSWILLLNQEEGERRYSIQGSNILSLNLNNLDRVNAIAADEPFKRRGPIEDILCEAHYCAYGRCLANERGKLTCQCPEDCPSSSSPVCGSDNSTYQSECHLIKEGCKRQRPLFVTKESSCS